jgi:hypothetical protein
VARLCEESSHIRAYFAVRKYNGVVAGANLPKRVIELPYMARHAKSHSLHLIQLPTDADSIQINDGQHDHRIFRVSGTTSLMSNRSHFRRLLASNRSLTNVISFENLCILFDLFFRIQNLLMIAISSMLFEAPRTGAPACDLV